MRRTAVIALFLVAMLLVPVQGGDVSAQQEQQEDPRQPNANNTTMYLYHDGFADAWSHFNASDEESNVEGEYREEKDNGLINVNLRFRMKPDLQKTLLMEENGEFRGNFKIDVGGDWTNGDNNGPCNNDCENLNITIFRGAAEVWTNQFTGIQQGEQNVPFAFAVTEDHAEWDGRDDNPIIEVTCILSLLRSFWNLLLFDLFPCGNFANRGIDNINDIRNEYQILLNFKHVFQTKIAHILFFLGEFGNLTWSQITTLSNFFKWLIQSNTTDTIGPLIVV